MFNYYYEHVILQYQNQIQSLHLSNPFVIDAFFSSVSPISKFFHLQTFIIQGIQSKYLRNLLNELFLLPNLSSLVIKCQDKVANKSDLYKQIFRLSALKYCKLSLKGRDRLANVPVETNEFISITHLAIEGTSSVDEIVALLSYVPQLQRLSIHELAAFDGMQPNIHSAVSNNLTHVFLDLGNVYFDHFEPLIKHVFHQVQVLQISTPGDQNYLMARRWESLILRYMPHLRIFDIHHHAYINNERNAIYADLVDQFESPFWLEREWFFAYYTKVMGGNSEVYFCSADPYRYELIYFFCMMVDFFPIQGEGSSH